MATAADLLGKKPAQRILNIVVDPDEHKSIDVLIRSIGRKPWEKLIEGHPATDEQQNDFVQQQLRQGVPPSRAERLRWNHETFPPAAIAACLVDPVLTIDQAQEIWDSERWSQDELAKLFAGCVAVNETSGTAEWGKGSAATRDSETSSPSAATTGSRTPSSKPGPRTTRTKR